MSQDQHEALMAALMDFFGTLAEAGLVARWEFTEGLDVAQTIPGACDTIARNFDRLRSVRLQTRAGNRDVGALRYGLDKDGIGWHSAFVKPLVGGSVGTMKTDPVEAVNALTELVRKHLIN